MPKDKHIEEEDESRSRLTGASHSREGEEDEAGGADGGSSQIEFHDFLSPNKRSRDDELPYDELKRLQSVHHDTHEMRVKKQKALRERRQAVKEGKLSLNEYRQGLGQGNSQSNYKPNPVLSDKVQFSGIDKQENPLPSENENKADANPELRNELQNRLTNRLQNRAQPHFNPKPSPYR